LGLHAKLLNARTPSTQAEDPFRRNLCPALARVGLLIIDMINGVAFEGAVKGAMLDSVEARGGAALS
jgi:hypothetical protein